MTDLERIHFIEETFGFKLHHVPIEKLETENIFYVKFSILINFSGIEDGNFYYRGTRNYSTDSKGNVTGLELDFSPVYLLPRKLLSEFYFLKQLRLKNSFLGDVAFLKTLTNLTSLDLSYNKKIKDYSFLKNLKNLTSLDLSDNGLSDVSFLKDLKNINTLVLSNNKEIKDYSFLKKLRTLTSLDLCSNDLNDISFLEELKSITTLYLNINNLRDVSSLRKLKNLVLLDLRRNSLSNKGLPLEELERINSLYLGYNDINDIAFLNKFKNLSILDLRRNNLSDISSLKNLKELSFLDLSYNSINDISFIIDHKKIRELSLRGNNLNNLSCLSNLKSISSLDISDNNQIKDYSFLKTLNDINSLDLRKNYLNDISFLENIENLLFLDLSYNNQITDYSILKKLKRLTSLNLNHNNLSDISFLKKLKNLTSLDLGKNHLINVSSLENLKKLNSLVINYNKIKDIAFLENLKEIRSLDLRRNEIADASSLKNLKDIVSVDLSGNRLRDVSFLQELKSLTSLDLSFNYLNDVSYLKEIKGLSSLGLCDNYISDVSFINELKGINKIDFSRNPIEGPPQEIIEKGIEEIWEYFRQKEEQGEDYIYEAKMLIVGEPGAGKTTLFKKLQNPSFLPQNSTPNEKESTVGINIRMGWEFPFMKDASILFKTNLWDFGGQVKQYILHQYFLTERSLYVLLADDRRQLTNFHYWFEVIGNLGGDACNVLVVLNELNHKSVTNFDLSEYSRQFPKLSITKKDVDFSINDRRFDDLMLTVKTILSTLPHIGLGLPAQWIPIRKQLEERIRSGRNYISLDEYEGICNNNKLKREESKKLLLGYFHDLGIALHYHTDDNLRNYVILNPNWVVDALYAVLIDTYVLDNFGKFTTDWINRIWKKQGYNNTDCGLLLSLMKKGKFEICYQLENCNNQYIVPALLPFQTPSFEFDYSKTLQLRFSYVFMPPGILWRLIVRLNHLIAKQNNKEIVWQRGVLLEQNEAISEVIELIDQKVIEIRISGKESERRNLLSTISSEIKKIHYNWFDNRLRYTELVPCNCRECNKNGNPHFFKLKEHLQHRLSKKRTDIDCEKSLIKVNILELLGEVYNLGYERQNATDFNELIRFLRGRNLNEESIINIIQVFGNDNIIGQSLKESKLGVYDKD